jgi:uncharacterized lipoprotein YddW (UPF0748 family)
MNALLNRLKDLNINTVILNNTVFIVDKAGDLLLASEVLTQLKLFKGEGK